MKISAEKYPTSVEIPNNLSDIQNLIVQHNTIISGGTILQINWEAGVEKPKHLISTEKLPELKGIEEVRLDGQLYMRIGAAMTISDCLNNSFVRKNASILAEACEKIAAPAVRNRGTIGGNICSKIGDTIPVLLVLEAKLSFYNGEQEKMISLRKWLAKPTPPSSELLTNIFIPIINAQNYSFFKKIGRRETFTAAIISVAGYLEYEESNIKAAKLSIGGGAHLPCRLTLAEEELNKGMKEIDWSCLYKKIQDDFSSYTDPFVTADYRKKVAANLFLATIKDFVKKQRKE
ncbi:MULTISPECIES: FAD binding domain-containing protein [Bacillaceae]|uniref:FAD binding domain-containing protein n=1 Tax=Bacillaceae TaxID=186817 RepID=UPI001F198192|nr:MULTISPECIES: FAD binding domain-containing protein [Bacillaceae]MCF2648427.1 FAD binding domain-containing protein [Niallia circulans]CAI9392048.1 putative xanthine dehydrogenase subunit C [Bacillus sp. T2.9-1]